MIITLSSVSLCHAWVWHEMILTAESKRAKEQQRKTHIHTFDVSSEMEKSSMHPSSSPASFEISIEIALSLSLAVAVSVSVSLSVYAWVCLSFYLICKQTIISITSTYLHSDQFTMILRFQNGNSNIQWYEIDLIFIWAQMVCIHRHTHTHVYVCFVSLTLSSAKLFFRMVLCWVEFLLSNCQWAMLDYRLFVYHLNSISFLWQSHLYTTLYEK